MVVFFLFFLGSHLFVCLLPWLVGEVALSRNEQFKSSQVIVLTGGGNVRSGETIVTATNVVHYLIFLTFACPPIILDDESVVRLFCLLLGPSVVVLFLLSPRTTTTAILL